MASTSSISGLASGLDSDTIITQLMQIEAQPQTNLKTRVTADTSLVTTLQAINTKVALLATKADALSKAAAFSPLTATSSSTAVAVSATADATPADLTVTVTGVARAHQLGFTTAAAKTDVVTGASTKVRIDRFDGSPVELETGDGTLSGLVTAINDPANATGLQASLVRVGDASYRLLVTSTATGAAQDFDLTAQDSSSLLGGATVRAGTDASVDIGAGITVTSSSNTFTDLLPGVTLTLSSTTPVGTVAAVGVARDTSRVTAAAKDLVDSINSLLSDIDAQTSYDATTKKSGPLAGDSGIRSLRSALLDSIYPSDGTSLASVGIQTTRTGSLTFDATAFAQAYTADPTAVAARFTGTDGFASRVAVVAKGASDPTRGTLTAAITGRQSSITQMQSDIADWDIRLALRQTSLKQTYTNLETALNSLNTQSSWLTSQLATLPTNKSS